MVTSAWTRNAFGIRQNAQLMSRLTTRMGTPTITRLATCGFCAATVIRSRRRIGTRTVGMDATLGVCAMLKERVVDGAGDRIRTDDLYITSIARYQLCHASISRKLEPTVGLEPTVSLRRRLTKPVLSPLSHVGRTRMWVVSGAGGGNRTPDNHFTKVPLYP